MKCLKINIAGIKVTMANNVNVPDGWKPTSAPKDGTVEDPKNAQPKNTVGTPQLAEGDTVVEDGFVNTKQYFLVVDGEGSYRSVVPGIGKDNKNKDYSGPKRKLRAEALEDGFKVLNSHVPDEFLTRAARRFPDSAQN